MFSLRLTRFVGYGCVDELKIEVVMGFELSPFRLTLLISTCQESDQLRAILASRKSLYCFFEFSSLKPLSKHLLKHLKHLFEHLFEAFEAADSAAHVDLSIIIKV